VNTALNARFLNTSSDSLLRFARAPCGETFLEEQLLRFPYHITRVHRANTSSPRADLCLQALGGGLVEGDNILLNVGLDPETHVRLTTQSSNKIHSMRGGLARQEVRLNVASGAWLEYLPRPLILFPDSDSSNRTCITLHSGGAAVVIDAFYPHDPLATDRTPKVFTNTVEVHDTYGRLLVRDALGATAEDFYRQPEWVGGLTCQCSIFFLGRAAQKSVLKGFRRRTALADRASSQLPNDAGWCVRGFVGGAEALLRVVDELLAQMRAESNRPVNPS